MKMVLSRSLPHGCSSSILSSAREPIFWSLMEQEGLTPLKYTLMYLPIPPHQLLPTCSQCHNGETAANNEQQLPLYMMVRTSTGLSYISTQALTISAPEPPCHWPSLQHYSHPPPSTQESSRPSLPLTISGQPIFVQCSSPPLLQGEDLTCPPRAGPLLLLVLHACQWAFVHPVPTSL